MALLFFGQFLTLHSIVLYMVLNYPPLSSRQQKFEDEAIQRMWDKGHEDQQSESA